MSEDLLIKFLVGWDIGVVVGLFIILIILGIIILTNKL
jgi:tetrahydromethanopterin S-methyltransferase subunit G